MAEGSESRVEEYVKKSEAKEVEGEEFESKTALEDGKKTIPDREYGEEKQDMESESESEEEKDEELDMESESESESESEEEKDEEKQDMESESESVSVSEVSKEENDERSTKKTMKSDDDSGEEKQVMESESESEAESKSIADRKSDDEGEEKQVSESESESEEEDERSTQMTIPDRESEEDDDDHKRRATKTIPSVIGQPASSKRRRRAVDNGDQNAETMKRTKTNVFWRKFSVEDEIAILEGLFKFAAARKEETVVLDMKEFLEFIKKSLHFEPNKTQLYEKTRRLRIRYERNAGKGRRALSAQHGQEIFKLSEKIWGEGAPLALTNNKKNETKSVPPIQNKGSEIWGRWLRQGFKEMGIDPNLIEMIEESKRLELEKKWRKFEIEAVEHYLRRVEFEQERVEAVIKAMREDILRTSQPQK